MKKSIGYLKRGSWIEHEGTMIKVSLADSKNIWGTDYGKFGGEAFAKVIIPLSEPHTVVSKHDVLVFVERAIHGSTEAIRGCKEALATEELKRKKYLTLRI